MPELPEVETVRRTLEHRIIGEEIEDVVVRYDGIIRPDTAEHFTSTLKGEKITRMERYGKYLIFILSNVSIVSHLRMEGKYFIKKIDDYVEKHEHILFQMKSGMSLRYHDTRKFGTMKIVNSTVLDEILQTPEIKKLGVEANDPNLDYKSIYNLLQAKTTPIKTALLDQEMICGIGNIYADEICFKSDLNPLKPANLVTLYECKQIVKNSQETLNEAIKCGGTTIRSYTSSLGVTGRFQLNLCVHQRENEECPTCKNIIRKITVGGRGTYYCDKCQRTKLVVGVTGGISSGKSCVTNYIKEQGFEVIDTDLIVKNLYNTDLDLLLKIKEAFGESYFSSDGELDKAKLGKLIFNDVNCNKKLTDLVHPRVLKEVLNRIKKSTGRVVFIDVPLLFESGFDELCNYTICVNVDLETNISRLMLRDNIDRTYALEKINSQMPLDLKCQRANYIIDNSKDLCYTYEQVNKILNILKERGNKIELKESI